MLKYDFKELDKPVVIDEPAIADVIITNDNKSVAITVTTTAGQDETKLDVKAGLDIRFTTQIGNVDQVLFGGTDNWGYYKLILPIGNEANAVEYDSILVHNITVDHAAGEGNWCICEQIDENTLRYTAISKNESTEPRYAIFKHRTTDKIISGGEAAGRHAAPEWYVTVMLEGVNGPSPEPTPDPIPVDQLGTLLYKVGLISDIHMDVEDIKNTQYQEDLLNALTYFHNNNVDFIASAGDFCEYNDEDYEQFRTYYNTYGYANGMNLFACMGNHDYLNIYHQRSIPPQGYESPEMIWQTNISPLYYPHDENGDMHFFEYGAKWDDELYSQGRTIKSKLNYWFEKEGDIFVFMSIDYGSSTGSPWDDVARGFNLLDYNNQYVQQMTSYISDTNYNRTKESNFDYLFYNPEVLIWLKDIIENNTDKRIFVFNHHFLPHKAGDVDGKYSRLRIWPYPTTETAKNKFYSGSNSLCGMTFWFINKLNNIHKNVVWFSGHSHAKWDTQSITKSDYNIKQPTGNEVMPIVDDLSALKDTEYDYKLYTRTSSSSKSQSGIWVGLPSLSKPVNLLGLSEYQASQGGILEVYENGIIIKEINFKENTSNDYINDVIKSESYRL